MASPGAFVIRAKHGPLPALISAALAKSRNFMSVSSTNRPYTNHPQDLSICETAF